MKYSKGQDPSPEETLARIEEATGAPLPADYRRFPAEHGGGRAAPDDFEVATRAKGTLDELYQATLDKRVNSSLTNTRGVFSNAIHRTQSDRA